MATNTKRPPQRRSISKYGGLAMCTVALLLAGHGVFASVEQPLKGTVDTTFTLTPTAFDPQTGVLTASVHVEGGGQLSLLGNVAQTIDQTVMLNVQTLEGPLAGTTEIRAANGDRLNGYLTGATAPTSVPGVSSLTGAFVFTGGTGRFSGVAGSAAFTGTATFANPSDPSEGGTGHFRLAGALTAKD